jgi:hypothetical protein
VISAFGVEHTVSKAFRKLAPKLLPSLEKEGVNLDDRIKHNYAMARIAQGTSSKKAWKKIGWPEGERGRQAAAFKTQKEAMVTAAGNRSKRKRALP